MTPGTAMIVVHDRPPARYLPGVGPGEIRNKCRDKTFAVIDEIAEIVSKEHAYDKADRNRIKAFEVLAMIAMDQNIKVDDLKACLDAQQDAIAAVLPPELADALNGKLRQIWR